MGLDQFAYKIREEYDSKTLTKTTTRTEIAYWRKHNRLQGWMEELWHSRGDEAPEFNCQDMELTLDDITDLEEVIKAQELPFTEGFFYGHDSYSYTDGPAGSKYQDEPVDLEFIKQAKKALTEGWTIVYSCWW